MLTMFATDSNFVFDSFYNSLPVAGVSGTLRNMCIGTTAQGNIRAKSGTVGRVKSYVGYATSKSGRLMSFAMISNNHLVPARQMRSHWEELMELIAGARLIIYSDIQLLFFYVLLFYSENPYFPQADFYTLRFLSHPLKLMLHLFGHPFRLLPTVYLLPLVF